jgi:hypothetical protein
MLSNSKPFSRKASRHGYKIKINRIEDNEPDSADRVAEVREILVHLLLLARRKGRPPSNDEPVE